MDKATLEALLGTELTDEQFETYSKQYESDLDKARTQASKTAAKNAEAKAKQTFESTLEDEATKRAKELLESLTQTEEERLEAERKAIEADKLALEQDKKTAAVEAKLKAAGYEGDDLDSLKQLFSLKETVDSCETATDVFLAGVQKTVDAKVDAIKAELTDGGVPPANGGAAVKATLNENKVLETVFKQLDSDGFVDNPTSQRELDAQAFMALDEAYEASGGEE